MKTRTKEEEKKQNNNNEPEEIQWCGDPMELGPNDTLTILNNYKTVRYDFIAKCQIASLMDQGMVL